MRHGDGDEPFSLGTGNVVRETDRALLVALEGDEVWIPKSVIHDESEVYSENTTGDELVVKTWWARANGYA